MSVNSTTGIYQSENNFDKFRVYVSPFISGHSVDTLTVNLNIVNPDEEMDIIELKLNKDTSNYFTQDLNLGVKYTSLPGQYRIYIKFINAEGVVGKTNCIHYVVEEIDEPADAISEKFITIIDQYNSRLIEIDQKIQEAGTVISVSNERSTPTSTIVFSDTGIMKIFDYNTFTSGGFFASNGCANAKYIFFPQTVTNIGSGVCAGLTKLEHVYIDNDANSKTLTVASSAFSLANGETATVHYKKDFHYGEFVARFLLNIGSRLNSLESNMSDLQNKTQDLEDDKADLVQSHNMFDWSKLLSAHTSAFTVDKNEDEGYRITGTTVNKYQQILTNQKLQLDDGDYYISDSAINNTDAIVYCQLALIDTDGKSTYYNNAKVTIDSSKYTSIYLSVQTGATVGEVDTVIYPMLCKYDDANIQYLPHRVSEGIPLIAGCIPNIKNNVSAKADNIVCSTDKASSCYLNDSSKNHIKGLSLYGNSIQSAVPTPTAPVTIDNVNNPTITLYKKNLFDMNRCTIHTNGKAILNSTDRVNSIINFTTNGNTVNSGVYMRHTDLNTPAGLDRGYGIDYTKLNGKSVTLSLDIQSDVDCRMRVQFTKYSYTDVDISSTKQRFSVTEVVDTSKLNKAFCFYLDNIEATVTISNIQIEVGSIATNYESRECNSLTIEKSLHGMGDVCDTLTVNSDGTGYITQRLFVERITSQKKSTSLEWNYSATTNRFFRNDYSYSFDVKDNKPLILCSHLDVGENEKNTDFDNSIGWINVGGVGIAIRMTEFDGDIAKFKKWLDDNEVYMVAPLAKPIRVDLSKVEVDKILSLYTYYPITTIIADCDFQLKYIADTKIYTDYKNDLLDEKIKQNSNDIQKKYDNSKIETGIGNIYYQGTNIIAKFNYTKIENMVTIQIAISNLPSDKNYLDCLGLPFIATIGQIYRWLAISSANNQYKLAVSGSHFYINKISGNFASDETITTTFSYLINS